MAPVLAVALVRAARHAADPDAGGSGDVVRVGVVQGESVDDYLDGARAELSVLPSTGPSGPIWALVSLDAYVPPGTLPSLLSGTTAAEVFARVPSPGADSQVLRIPANRIPADVETGMAGAADTRDQERAEYSGLARAVPVTDPARQAYLSAATAAGAEAAAYRAGCACVFAAVVRGDAAGLTVVASRPGVRVVDPAPEIRALDRADFRPLLPEQTGTVPPDPTSTRITVPNRRSGIAPAPSAPILSASTADVTSASSDDPARHPSDFSTEEHAAVPSPS